MQSEGIIFPDGSVRLLGCTPEKTRLVGLNRGMIAIHHPGGTYWDNSGRNYVSAWIEVEVLEDLKPGREPETWHYRSKRGHSISFHPTPSRAVENATFNLQRAAHLISTQFQKKDS